MSDPIVHAVAPARVASVAAARLAPEFGAGLPGDVEAVLHGSLACLPQLTGDLVHDRGGWCWSAC